MSDEQEGYSSSEDEEERLRNFDEEAELIIQDDTLPKKSADRYMLVSLTKNGWKKTRKFYLNRQRTT